MKETRVRFIPPPEPRKADPEEILLWIKRMNSLLPAYLDTLQKMQGEVRVQTYDVGVAVPDDENLKELEEQYATTDSAGIV